MTVRLVQLNVSPSGVISIKSVAKMQGLSMAQVQAIYEASPCAPTETWNRAGNVVPFGDWQTHRMDGKVVGVEAVAD